MAVPAKAGKAGLAKQGAVNTTTETLKIKNALVFSFRISVTELWLLSAQTH